ncbi:MAG: DNA topology modulation protein [Eubacteriales bacterium]|nr:DNA topology modulation protein [Eubacteriales bacterium]
MERIIILGCGGAGKSTLARAMGERTGIPVVHLDKIWWRDNWQHISREEFDATVQAEVQKPRWIIDGNYSRTIPKRLEACDTAIYLDFPRRQCLAGIFKRFLTNRGKTRPDMSPNCPEQIDWEFFQWVWNFNRDNRPELLELLKKAEHVRVIILKNRRQVAAFLNTLR